MLRLNNFIKKKEVEILLKLEGQNPQGSIKDRIALNMIRHAEESGELTHDKTIIEATSGNTGIGLAMVAVVKKYNITIVMSQSASIERRKVLRALGARIILTSAEKGTDGAINKVKELVNKYPDRYYWPNQYENPYNPYTHERYTAIEILEQTDYNVDYIVAGVGTSGTLSGLREGIKKYLPECKVVGVFSTKTIKYKVLKTWRYLLYQRSTVKI